MKKIFAILSLAALAFMSGCATRTSSVSGTTVTPALNVDKVALQKLGKTSTIKAEVVVLKGTTGALGSVTWGLNGTNYTSPLTGVSTSETVTLTAPATLAAGTYTVTASTPAATDGTYSYLSASGNTTLRVLDTKQIMTDIAPSIRQAFKTATILVLTNNPDLKDDIATTSAIVVTLLKSGMSDTEITAAIKAAYPKLDDATATLIGSGVASGWQSFLLAYKTYTGEAFDLSSLTGDETAILATAIAGGMNDGAAAVTTTE